MVHVETQQPPRLRTLSNIFNKGMHVRESDATAANVLHSSVSVAACLRPRDLAASRTALRTATQAIHQRMHRHPGLARLAAGTIGRDEYRRLLARSYGFYTVVEPVAGLPGRWTDRLVRDLIDLGMAAAAVSGLPRCMPLGIGDGQSETIGARYVLLGASLGGKVMAKAISEHHVGKAALPTRFLKGSGDNDWKVFASELEAALPDAASRSRAAVAATATFAAYEEWMGV